MTSFKRMSLVAGYVNSVFAKQSNEPNIERIQVVSKRSSVLTEITEDAEKLINMPGALGDPLLAVYALPGVVAAGGSMGEPAVRGSSPDDNYFEVDFMPAGYIFHDFGSSIFNKYLVQDFRLYSAGYGTSFSDATGAVFDVTLRNPKNQDIKTTVDFTMFKAGVFVEGALTDDIAFYLSGRKSTLPLFFSEGDEIEDEDGESTGITVNDAPDDYDYQSKFVWDVNANNVLSVLFTGAEDSAAASFSERADLSLKNPDFQGDAEFARAFDSQNIIWDHYGKGYQAKVGVGSLTHSGRLDYGRSKLTPKGYFEEEKEELLTYKGRVSINVVGDDLLTFDAAYFDKTISYEYDTFLYVCTELDPDCELAKGERITGKREVDIGSYFVGANYQYTITDSLIADIGVQHQKNDYSDESFTHPRLGLTYHINQDQSVWVKYGSYNRLQDIGTILEDTGNPNLKSQTANQSVFGYQQFLADDWSWSIETYYKTMDDLPLALTENDVDQHLRYSNDVTGRAYGVDLLINKNKTDRWYGWMSLSYGKSERTDERRDITRDYYADTPLVFNMVFNYQISERWNGGFNFTARSGQSYTPIVGVRENPEFEGNFLPEYGEPFSERFDAYHRLDLRFERKTDFFGLDALLILEVMNLYAKDNTAYIDLDYAKVKSTDDLILQEQSDDFEMRPSVGFSFTF
ncbi:TonB-dependent receptor plug domain-containing protein [Pseudoalteromonas sp. G4]|uniref:TonB-dependent receptor plug domain-containing protein n=1 Tax=Pseudoalteromonas sp. G4 TaxID=2992761 RepID=UPI00237D6C50|nr:TonB-dependent receptor [Pseudoalteromonas sp. G4]MDE3274012.1 TonB-dependent receptor [Pseudoalteromonas sp. G4]